MRLLSGENLSYLSLVLISFFVMILSFVSFGNNWLELFYPNMIIIFVYFSVVYFGKIFPLFTSFILCLVYDSLIGFPLGISFINILLIMIFCNFLFAGSNNRGFVINLLYFFVTSCFFFSFYFLLNLFTKEVGLVSLSIYYKMIGTILCYIMFYCLYVLGFGMGKR